MTNYLSLSHDGNNHDLKQLLELQKKNQSEALQQWVKQHPKQAKQYFRNLLVESVVIRSHFLGAVPAEVLQLLQNLSQMIPDFECVQVLDMLKVPDFHNQWFVWLQQQGILQSEFLHNPEARICSSNELNQLLVQQLSYGYAYLFNTSHLQVLNPEASYEIYDKLSHHSFSMYDLEGIEGESPEDSGQMWQIDMFPSLLYQGVWQSPDLQAEVEKMGEAPYTSPINVLILTHVGALISDSTLAWKFLEKALNQSRKLKQPLLEFQILLSFKERFNSSKDLEKALHLLNQMPTGDSKLYAQKLLADNYWNHNQFEQAQKLYQELAQSSPNWLKLWLIHTFGQFRDLKYTQWLESWIQISDPMIHQAAIDVWLKNLPPEQGIIPIQKLLPGLSVSQQAYILEHMPLEEYHLPIDFLLQWVQSPQSIIQAAVLKNLSRFDLSYSHSARKLIEKLQVPLNNIVQSPDPSLKLAAYTFMLKQQQFDPQMLSLLDIADLKTRHQFARLLAPFAGQIPIQSIEKIKSDTDPEMKYHALAWSIIKGLPHAAADYLTIWNHESKDSRKLLYTEPIKSALGKHLASGQIKWSDWRSQLDRYSDIYYDEENGVLIDKGKQLQLEDNLELFHYQYTSKFLITSLFTVKQLTPQAIEQLDFLLENNSNQFLKVRIINLLQQAPQSHKRSQLISEIAFKTDNSELKAAALEYLGKESVEQWQTILKASLQDPSSQVRLVAKSYLVKIDPEMILQTLLQDESLTDYEQIQNIVDLAEKQIPTTNLAAAIKQIYQKKDVAFRAELATKLLWSGNPHYLDADFIQSILLQENPDGRLLYALKERPYLVSKTSIQALIQSKHPLHRLIGIGLSHAKGDFTIAKDLVSLLHDHSQFDRNEMVEKMYPIFSFHQERLSNSGLALSAIYYLEPEIFNQNLNQWLHDPDPKLQKIIEEFITRGSTMFWGYDLDPSLAEILIKEKSPKLRLVGIKLKNDHDLLEPQDIHIFLQDPDPEIRTFIQSLQRKIPKVVKPQSLAEYVDYLFKRPHRVHGLDDKVFPAGISRLQLANELILKLKKPSSADTNDYEDIIDTIAILGGRAVAQDLYKLFEQNSFDTEILKKFATTEDIPYFVSVLKANRNPEYTKTAIEILMHLNASNYSDLIFPLIQKEEKTSQGKKFDEQLDEHDVKEAAILYIGQFGTDSERMQLIPLLDDIEFSDIAQVALGKKFLQPAEKQILERLTDSDTADSTLALVGKWRLKSAVPILIGLLEQEQFISSHQRIQWVLGEISDPTAIPVLKALFSNPNVSIASYRALAALGEHEFVKSHLIQHFEYASTRDRSEILNLMEMMPDPAWKPFLIQLLPSRELYYDVSQDDYGASYSGDSRVQLGDIASQILFEQAQMEDLPMIIKALPNLPGDRRADVQKLIEQLRKRGK